MTGYYAARRARSNPAPAAPSATSDEDQAKLGQILGADEEPSTFESLFRFLGRPAFMVRDALSGDFGGVARNALQMGQEIVNPLGILNQNWNVSNLFGVKDLTSKQDRPEFTDLLHRWGMLDDPTVLNSWEKFGLDLVGGAATDPLMLVGGGAEVRGAEGAAKLASGGFEKTAAEFGAAIRRGGGPELNAALTKAEAVHFDMWGRQVVPVANPLGDVPAGPIASPGSSYLSFPQPRTPDPLEALAGFRERAQAAGMSPETQAIAEATLRGRAANDVFVQVARQEGLDLRMGVNSKMFTPQSSIADRIAGTPESINEELASAFGPNAQRRFAMIAHDAEIPADNVLGAEVRAKIVQGNLVRRPFAGLGRTYDMLYSPMHETVADRVVGELSGMLKSPGGEAGVGATIPNDLSTSMRGPMQSLTRGRGGLTKTLNVMRDLGYHDEWTVPFLRDQFGDMLGNPEALLNSTDEYIRLGNSMPLSIASNGLEALVRRGMSPGGGLSFTPLWSDTLGRAAERLTGWKYRNGFVFVPWRDLGKVTAPGMIRAGAEALGWKGPMLADEALGRGATWITRNIYSRFHFGAPGGMPEGEGERIANAAEEITRNATATHDGNLVKLGRDVAENMVGHIPQPDGTSLPVIDADTRLDLGFTQFQKEQTLHNARVAMAREGAVWDVPTSQAAMREIASHVDHALPNVRAAARAAQGILTVSAEHAATTRRLSQEAQLASAAAGRALNEASRVADLRFDIHDLMQRHTSVQESQQAAQHEADRYMNMLWYDAGVPAAATPERRAQLLAEAAEAAREASNNRHVWEADFQARLTGVQARAREMGLGTRQWMYDLTEANNLHLNATRTADAARERVATLNRSLADAMDLAQSDRQRLRAAAGETLLVARLTRELVDEVAERHPNVPKAAIEKSVAFAHEKMREIATYMRYGAKNENELLAGNPVARPAWEVLEDANPFYLPHQMDPRLVEALGSPELTQAQRLGIRTVFDRRREYATIDEFLTALGNTANELGIPADDVSELVQKDYAALTMQRGLAFERTKLRQTVHQDMIRLAGSLGGKWSVYKHYLDGVLSPVGPRAANTILGFLSGGRFEIPIKNADRYSETIAFLNRSMDTGGDRPFAKFVSRAGENYIRIEWPGLNAAYKPMLTSIPTNLRFRFRNLFSNPLQAMFHPDIKFAGMKPVLEAIRNDGAVRWGIRKFSKWAGRDAAEWSQDMGLDSAALHAMDPDQRVAWATQTFTRAVMSPSVSERVAARNALGGLTGIKHGPYTFSQVFDVMDQVIGNRGVNQSDLQQGIDSIQDLYGTLNTVTVHSDPNYMGQFVRKFREFVKTGEQWSGELETQWRMLTALQLMEKGKTPLEVVTEVNRLQVDYSRQSEIEGWIRAVIPFARYMIGASGWAGDMLRNPSGAGKGLVGRVISPAFLGMASRSLAGGETEQTLAPRYVKETLALPLPWLDKEGNQQFLTSLGFPQEVVINALSLVSGRPEAIKHVLLGSMQPALKLPAEALMGRSFYFGTDFGSYRKSPLTLEPFAQEVPGPNGTTRYEVPGIINELNNALPTAGIDSTINRLGDSRQGMAARLLNAVTGFRIQSSDREAELQRRISDYLRGQTRAGTVGELQVFFQRLKPEDVPPEVVTVLKALEQLRADRRKGSDK